jgi:hypothetical protein
MIIVLTNSENSDEVLTKNDYSDFGGWEADPGRELVHGREDVRQAHNLLASR